MPSLARDDGSHYLLNGEKMWVTNGAQAGIYVLFAKDVDPDFGVKKHGGTTAFIVEQAFEGLIVGKKRTSSASVPRTPARPSSRTARCPWSTCSRAQATGSRCHERAGQQPHRHRRLRLVSPRAALALKRPRARNLGKPIVAHQMIGAYLDMATQIEAARLLYRAAWAKEHHYKRTPRHSKEASSTNSSLVTRPCG